MALEKKIDTDFGIPVQYHKMTEVRLLECGQLRMRLDSYPSIQQRIDGKESLIKKEYIIEHADKIILQAFYSLLKASFPEFADATDVIDDTWKEVAIPEGKSEDTTEVTVSQDDTAPVEAQPDGTTAEPTENAEDLAAPETPENTIAVSTI